MQKSFTLLALVLAFAVLASANEININFAGLLSGASLPTTPTPTTPAPTPAWLRRDVDYTIDGKVYQGYVSYLDNGRPKPAVVVLHDWDGLDAYEKKRADDQAKLGYVGFAADLYGKGIRPVEIPDRASNVTAFSGNRTAARLRLVSHLNFVRTLADVDATKIAVSGYCFGGSMAIEAARAGFPLSAAVGFHGNPSTPIKVANGTIRANLLVLVGARDTSIPDSALLDFQNEMRNSTVYYNLVSYSNAVHAFTVPNDNPTGNNRYDADADKKSHREMNSFLNDLWGA
eukprot:TRINITY_DN2305_c0_g1_i1.p1 TRINITY_DN2305_c0_g1~~TRINITY_DN2305_c0_g1_i1.p1  ORF type:complete len:319 (-),score=116.81 TRINITY_DN2305_c0_g1_i1:49-909(-)